MDYYTVSKLALDNCIVQSLLIFLCPKGSLLGLLYTIYIFPLGSIFRKHEVKYHIFADDCQIYSSINSHDCTRSVLDFLSEVSNWLGSMSPSKLCCITG